MIVKATVEELNALAQLIDSAVRYDGVQSAQNAAFWLQKLQNAEPEQESKDAEEKAEE